MGEGAGILVLEVRDLKLPVAIVNSNLCTGIRVLLLESLMQLKLPAFDHFFILSAFTQAYQHISAVNLSTFLL